MDEKMQCVYRAVHKERDTQREREKERETERERERDFIKVKKS